MSRTQELTKTYAALEMLAMELGGETEACKWLENALDGVIDGGNLTLPRTVALRELFNGLRQLRMNHAIKPPMTVSEFEAIMVDVRKNKTVFFAPPEHAENERRAWAWAVDDAKGSQWVLFKKSERRYAILRRTVSTYSGDEWLGVPSAEYVEGLSNLDYSTAQTEILRLRQEEREARKEKEEG